MKSEKLLDAIGMVGEDLILEAKAPRKMHLNWKHWTAMAACLALIISAFSIPPKIHLAKQLSYSPDNAYIGIPTLSYGSGLSAELVWPEFHFTVRANKVLPDTYILYDDVLSHPVRLIEMQVIRTHNSDNSVKSFYFVLQEEYLVDLTKYDKLILCGLDQISVDQSVIYNTTRGKAEVINKTLFATTTSFSGGSGIIAITDNVFDESLWTINDLWSKSTEYSRENLGKGICGYGWTVERIEAAIQERYTRVYHIDTIADITNPVAKKLLNEIIRCENGIYSPWEQSFRGVYFRRYINGFPTNETILFAKKDTYNYTIYENGIMRSGQTFNAFDQMHAPSLSNIVAELERKINNREIAPPHIVNYQNMELRNHSMMGWYFKANRTVYGVVRIDFTYYEDLSKEGTNHGKMRYDDIYYLIESGSNEYRVIDRDELKDLQGTEDFIFNRGYDENGKRDPHIFA